MQNRVYVLLNSPNVPSVEGDVICADAGIKFVDGKKQKIVAVLGDFDSFDGRCEFETVRFPSHKNMSDGVICADYAAEKGYGEIVFCGVTGGRFDHQLSNLSLLKYARQKGGRAFGYDVEDGKALYIYFAAEPISIDVKAGDIVSVMPFDSVTVDGADNLEYPLDNLTITSSDLSRGLSNIAVADGKASFNIVKGEAFILRYTALVN